MFFNIIIILSLAHSIICVTDYCDEKLCRYDSEDNNTTIVIAHIGCKNKGGFDSDCIDPEMIKMDAESEEYILDHHNYLRNKLAIGNITNLPSASKMPTLLWNIELAHLAEMTAKQCDNIVDKCRNTEKFRFVGQNIGLLSITNETDYKFIFKLIIDEWFSECNHVNKSDIAEYRAIDSQETYEHFGVMSNDKTTEVGCAGIKYRSSENDGNANIKNFMLVCNYSFSNFIRQCVYKMGPTASACKTGTNALFKGLCSKKEKVESIPDSV